MKQIFFSGGSCEKRFRQADDGCYGLTTDTAYDGQDGSEAERLCKKLHEDATVMPKEQYCWGGDDKITERFTALEVSQLDLHH